MTNKNTNKPILITGGAGFIGINLADKLLSNNFTVRIFDDLSRNGVEQNLNWLCEKYKERVQIQLGSIKQYDSVYKAVKNCESIYHFAAQVSLSASLVNPLEDFETNVKGTLHLLEAVKNSTPISSFVFTSSGKVYGSLHNIELTENHTRYLLKEPSIYNHGFNESMPVRFNTPYGCSKGSADQYVLDYFSSFNIPSVVLRLGSIYGPHQHGSEEQGWLTHFLLQTINLNGFTIFGDGRQVRDVLYIDDLVEALDLVRKNIKKTAGHIFNIGGGINNSISLLELMDTIFSISGLKPKILFDDWRTGDQKYYVSDTAKIKKMLNWSPSITVQNGIKKLYKWLLENKLTKAQLRNIPIKEGIKQTKIKTLAS